MTTYLAAHPRVLSLLEAVKETPEDDGPRLVLADFLEDHGDPDRAEFIRLQCRHGPPDEEREAREDALLGRHGGAWLGPLWRWWLSPVAWHRGLLSAGLPRHLAAHDIGEALPWIDTLLVQVTGRASLQRLPDLVAACRPNHLSLDLKMPMKPYTLLDPLAEVGPCPNLRTLTLDWPLLRPAPAGCEEPAGPGNAAFIRLLLALPLCRRLTHVASMPALGAGVVPAPGPVTVDPAGRLWMHGLAKAGTRRRPGVA